MLGKANSGGLCPMSAVLASTEVSAMALWVNHGYQVSLYVLCWPMTR